MASNTPLKPDASNTQTSQIQVPQANPYNIQAVKKYIFNETGNIMLSSTDLNGDQITESVQAVFAEVSVFFAAMTKAISTTIDPDTGQPYSLYDYTALQNVIDGSGLFVHVTEEDVLYNTTTYGANFSKELIEGLLGLATGEGELAFAQAMIASMGSAGLNIGGNTSSSDTKVANIIFICEFLLGMPIVSAMVVYCDAKENEQTFKAGPCFSESSTTTSLTMHKDTYLFVTPTFIKNYAGDLESITTNQEYLEFVNYLQSLVSATPLITALEVLGDTTNSSAPSVLTVGTTYVILGNFLSNNETPSSVQVAWVGPDNKPGAQVSSAQIQDNIISFSPTEMTTPTAIGVYFNGTLAVATPMVYTAASGTTTNASVKLSPDSVKIPKDETGNGATPTVKVSLKNANGATIKSIKSFETTDNNGDDYKQIVPTVNTDNSIITLTYTKPSAPITVSGTVTFSAKLTEGDPLSGTINFSIT